MGTFFYLMREGIHGLYRAKLMTAVSIATIAVAILLAACITTGIINIRNLFRNAAEEADVVVYVKEKVSSDTMSLDSLVAAIEGLPEVRKVSTVDKTAAWDRFTAIYGTEMLSAVDENPFPVSLEITMENGHQTSEAAAGLKDRLETLGGVDGIRFSREWMDLLERFRWYFRWAAVILGTVMLVTLHVTISNSVRLTIYARSELVRNMHLVGATRVFISMPFIIEGIIQGIVGGAAGTTVFYLVKMIFIFEPSLRTIQLAWGPPYMPALFILLGVVFGWTGSFFAVRKFLA